MLAQVAAALLGRELAAALRGRAAAPWVEEQDEAGGGAARGADAMSRYSVESTGTFQLALHVLHRRHVAGCT